MKPIKFTELPRPTGRKLMRDLWMGTMGAIRSATQEKYPATAPDQRPWVCVYTEEEEGSWDALLSHEDVHARPEQMYFTYGARRVGGVDIRPARSVRGAIQAQLSLADAKGEFEIIVRDGAVFARYVGEMSP